MNLRVYSAAGSFVGWYPDFPGTRARMAIFGPPPKNSLRPAPQTHDIVELSKQSRDGTTFYEIRNQDVEKFRTEIQHRDNARQQIQGSRK